MKTVSVQKISKKTPEKLHSCQKSKKKTKSKRQGKDAIERLFVLPLTLFIISV